MPTDACPDWRIDTLATSKSAKIISLDDLPALLQTIQAGGGMGQSVPKAADPNDKEDTEE